MGEGQREKERGNLKWTPSSLSMEPNAGLCLQPWDHNLSWNQELGGLTDWATHAPLEHRSYLSDSHSIWAQMLKNADD